MIGEFKPNKIILDKEIISEELKTARLDKGLTIKKVANDLNINQKYLEALEDGNFSILPEGTYGKSFLKEYAFYLGLKPGPLLDIYETEILNKKKSTKEIYFSNQIIKKHNFLIFPKIIKIFLIVVIVLVCLVYLGFRLKQAVSPPTLYITEPMDNLITLNKTVNIIGSTDAEAQIYINGELVVQNAEGVFTKKVNLKTGVNSILISARKKYSREKIVEKQILVK